MSYAFASLTHMTVVAEVAKIDNFWFLTNLVICDQANEKSEAKASHPVAGHAFGG